MNREYQPCGMCARFPPATRTNDGVERTGHCSGWEKPVLSTDRPCVLFNERRGPVDKQPSMPGKRQRPPAESISRASAPNARK